MQNRSLRIRTNVSEDKYVHVQLDSSVSNIELLSLNISTEGFYKLHSSDYGCIAGRVLANDAVGIPNAKLSVFIATENTIMDDVVLHELYPYTDIYVKDSDNVRYNLLPNEKLNDCHTVVGTFPSKRMVLDNDNYIEVYEDYYKFTTRTNEAGDYFIFGVPVGMHTVHTDIDLSDIGILSQKPRDMVYKGYDINLFENPNKFKYSSNLDNLTHIISQNDTVDVYSFWGDADDSGDNTIKITRNDVSVQYKFEPTCVFMGSLISDDRNQGVSRKCIPTERMGYMGDLTTGSGTIEMIRKTIDGNVEEFQIEGNHLIDGNGVWCYQIPMNLDYVKSDEFGNLVPTDNPEKGIPTRTSVRFRISLGDYESDFENNHVVKLLVPNNPKTPYEGDNLKDEPIDYNFGSKTTDESFKDLFWNNVYTVKSYIPRFQKGNINNTRRFSGFKGVNRNNGKNHLPYNNMRVKLSFMFTLQCAMIRCTIWVMRIVNRVFNLPIIKRKSWAKCIHVGDGICPDLEGWFFAPGCKYDSRSWNRTWKNLKADISGDEWSTDGKNNDTNETVCLTNQRNYLLQCMEINLAMEYEVINFDFYNDWVNGVVYVPRWFAKIRKKRTRKFLGIKLRTKKEKLMACTDEVYSQRRLTQQCALSYSYDEATGTFTNVNNKIGCKSNSKNKCHKKHGRKQSKIFGGNVKPVGGVVHKQETMLGEFAWYPKPCEWHKSYDNRYENRCLLYATDIVLLGSLNDYDNNGTPQAFKYLTPTSYNMPTNLASTNMDNDGYMYGLDNGKDSICSKGRTDKPVEPNIDNQTFDAFVEWSKKKEYYEAEPDDVTEYAITENSGIDWGYTGPNQGKVSKDRFYAPGGMFLGISCSQSDVNIKSCVNLYRACEIGSSASSRNYVTLRKGDDFDYVYTIPTGLIARDDINMGEFRTMFATMNINGLKTVVDEETGLLRYDFVSVKPTNFNGDLKNKVLGGDYKEYYNKKDSVNDDQAGNVDKRTQAVYRTLESTSVDYYKFRLGLIDLPTQKELTKYYQYYDKSGKSVSMPVYENSFYFYFGLNNGNTAIDKFFEKYYASCTEVVEDQSYFMVTSKNGTAYDEHGSIHLEFNDIESPYTITLTDLSDYKTILDIETNNSVYDITNLKTTNEGRAYQLYVSDANGETFEKVITLYTEPPSEISKIEVEVVDAPKKHDIDTLIVTNNNDYEVIIRLKYDETSKDYNLPAKSKLMLYNPALIENTAVKVYYIVNSKEFLVDSVVLKYNVGIDVWIYDEKLTAYSTKKKLGDNMDEWLKSDILTIDQKWCLQQALMYTSSVYDTENTHEVPFSIVNGEAPITYLFTGTAEGYEEIDGIENVYHYSGSMTVKSDDSEGNSDENSDEDEDTDYTLDWNSIMIPTQKCVTEDGGKHIIDNVKVYRKVTGAVKENYKLTVEDNIGDKIELKFNVYYAPFYFVALFDATNKVVKSNIVNGITYNGLFGSLVINNTDETENFKPKKCIQSFDNLSTYHLNTYVEENPVGYYTDTEQSFVIPEDGDYSYSISEGAPEGHTGKTKKLSYSNVFFIDDSPIYCNMFDVLYFYVPDKTTLDNYLTIDQGIFKKENRHYKSVIGKNTRTLNNLYELYISKVDVATLTAQIGQVKKESDTLRDETYDINENTKDVTSSNKELIEQINSIDEAINEAISDVSGDTKVDINITTGGDITDVVVEENEELYNKPETVSEAYVALNEEVLENVMYDITGGNTSGFIIGVYDNWTKKGITPTYSNLWEEVKKHSDIMAVVKHYPISDFKGHLNKFIGSMISINFG